MLLGIALTAIGVSSVGVIAWLLFFTDDELKPRDKASPNLADGNSLKSVLAASHAPEAVEQNRPRRGAVSRSKGDKS
jgi:hypothetical protein